VTRVTGTVVARYRRHCLVEDATGLRVSCQLQRRSLKPVVGDSVSWELGADSTGLITEVLPRNSELTRIDARGRPEVVAANLTQLAIVLAADPTPDWFLLDRYLVAAELGHFNAFIVFNKIDLVERLPAALDRYAALGYETRRVSAIRRRGLDEIESALLGQRSAMIGQSGVGKSSLLNALLGDTRQTVASLSQKSGLGRHTTSTAVLYTLPSGGELIDSPGVRDYAPFIADARDVARGFREFADLRAACRFQDCRHIAEPDCAIKSAVADQRIHEQRYASYQQIYELTESLQANQY
jgi:ribosome biogenesis GTPase